MTRTTTHRLLQGVRGSTQALLDVLFPVTCISCGSVENMWLCASCASRIAPSPARCPHCRRGSLHGRTCGECRTETVLEGVISVGTYGDATLRDVIHAFKFEGVRDVADVLGMLLARQIQAALGGVLSSFTVVPLPLHRRRERARGYNQSALLARHVGSLLTLPVVELLERTTPTSPQTTIDATLPDLRQKNIAGAFQYRPTSQVPRHEAVDRAPVHILLVDDVTTTGATLEEAARVLYHHGAQTIWGAVICRG